MTAMTEKSMTQHVNFVESETMSLVEKEIGKDSWESALILSPKLETRWQHRWKDEL